MEVVAGLTLKNMRPRVCEERSPEFMPGLTAVMLSFDEIRRRPKTRRRILAEGLHSIFGIKSDDIRGKRLRIFVDNGAFACLRRGDEPAVAEFREFVGATTPTWYPVPADYIPLPSYSRKRRRDLFRKTVSVLESHTYDGFCPVIHPGPWLDGYLETLQRLNLTRQLAIGGLVPHLLNSEGARRRQTISLLCRIRREFPGTIHAFGIGGIVTLHLAAALGIDTADSSGWRQRAARGLIILRGKGERRAAELGSWNGRALGGDEWDDLTRCRCPSCRRVGIDGLKARGVAGFAARAGHNLAVLLAEAKLINRHLANGDFPKWTMRRVRGHYMAPLVACALEGRP